MNCAEIRLLLNADMDGELDPANSLGLQDHLKTCPTCSSEKDTLLGLKTALRGSPLRYQAPGALREAVRRMAKPAVDRKATSLLQSLAFWRWFAIGATSVALLTILVRPAGISEHDQFISEAVDSHVRSLMVDHVTDVASTDQHTVKPWFEGKVDFAPDVKDFAAQGFPLVGGRLDYLHGRTVAALVYRRDRHLINVFVWPPVSDVGRKSKVERLRGYCVINREANGLHYCLVSDLNESALLKLAELFGP